MPQEKRTTKREVAKRQEAQSNVVAVVAVVALTVISIVDLRTTPGDVPVFIYYGLVGAALGAKWEAIADRFGGKK